MRPSLLLVLGLLLPLLPAQKAPDLAARLGLAEFRIRPIVWRQEDPAESGAWSFLAGGHLYGSPEVAGETLAPTLKAHLSAMRRPSDRVFVSLGDLVYRPDEGSLTRMKTLLHALGLPVFNAPGNHEWRRLSYARNLGEDFGCFALGSSLMVVLNTEITPWFIQGRQLEMLRRIAAAVARGGEVTRVFLFSHKVLWAVGEERYRKVFEHANGHDGFQGVSNYPRDVKPLIEEMARHVPVVFLSGDVGMPWSRTLFLDRKGAGRIVFGCVGLGNRPEDALLRVHVPPRGAVRFEVVPLGERAPREVGACGLEAWAARFKSERRIAVLLPVKTSAELPGPIRVGLPDEDRDGIPDGVVFRIPVRPGRVGRQHLEARLRIADHPVVYSLRSEGFEAAGEEERVVSLRVPARTILSAGRNGPLLLMDLRLVRESTSSRPPAASLSFAAFSDYLFARDFSIPILTGPELVLRGTRQEFRIRSPHDAGHVAQVLLSRAREPALALRAFDPRKRDDRLLPLAGDDLFKSTYRDGGGLVDPPRGVLDADGEGSFRLVLPRDFACPRGELFLVGVVFDPEAPLSIRAFSRVLRVRVR